MAYYKAVNYLVIHRHSGSKIPFSASQQWLIYINIYNCWNYTRIQRKVNKNVEHWLINTTAAFRSQSCLSFETGGDIVYSWRTVSSVKIQFLCLSDVHRVFTSPQVAYGQLQKHFKITYLHLEGASSWWDDSPRKLFNFFFSSLLVFL